MAEATDAGDGVERWQNVTRSLRFWGEEDGGKFGSYVAIAGSGNLIASAERDFSASGQTDSAGKVRAWYLSEGDWVRLGDDILGSAGDDMSYIDVSALWEVTDYATVRLGINNLFDEEPPFAYQGGTARENGNTYPGIYDPLGQYLFAGVTFQF